MRIGIDISQIVYEGTGVGRYVQEMVSALVRNDKENEYILFGSSLRQKAKLVVFAREIQRINPHVRVCLFSFPPVILDLFWNRFHIFPIELFIGAIDIFWSSDWTQPPLKAAIGVTTIHDLTIFRYPESFVTKIVSVHKRRLHRAVKACAFFFCDSEATKKDAIEYLGIASNRLQVVYPGFHLGGK